MAESSTDFVSTNEATVSGVWGRIMFFTLMTSAALHAIWAALAVAKLVPKHPRFLFVPLAYFVIGLAYTFLRCWVLALAVGLVHLSLRSGMAVEELAFYVFWMCFVSLFYSAGRVPQLYAM
mmetsp:Transcript_30802/g.95139  ORF Transcript_30802/g.95139 Transcript_30802/m.95139 type:complete len:121 (-) Transcript_30802:6-368(-)